MSHKPTTDLRKLRSARELEAARSYQWAEKAVHYRGAGLLRQAERAEYHVMRCLQRLKRLEDRSGGLLAGG